MQDTSIQFDLISTHVAHCLYIVMDNEGQWALDTPHAAHVIGSAYEQGIGIS